MKRKYLFLLLLCCSLTATAVNSSYYTSLNGKQGDALREALTELLYTKHTKFVSYNWDFPYDYDSDGNMLDIYSSCGYNDHNTYPTSYKCCCDAVNREHVVCQSSFGGSSNNGKVPQYSDRHHLYPVDGRANGHRSDLPFGECSNGKHGSCSSSSTIIPTEGTSTCENHEYGRSGASTFSVALPSGGGSVYEVGDEYKGDIARAILYMVVRYADKAHCRLPDNAKNATATLKTQNNYDVTSWANTTRDKVGQMFSSTYANYGLSDYGKALLLKWHRQDPVSAKEIARNNGVDSVQGNRNPFVDYPYLVEYLWGTKTSANFSTDDVVGSFESGFVVGVSDGSKTEAKTITVSTASITMDQLAAGGTSTKTFTVAGTNLTGAISIEKTGSEFITISSNSVSTSEAASGKVITVTYHPTATGNHTATLTLTSASAENKTVTISGSCCTPYVVTLYRNGQAEMHNACGTYTLPAANTEADACEGWSFRGWSATEVSETTNTPNFITQVNSATTLYAVYGYTVGGITRYEKVTSTSGITNGQYLIVYEAENVAFDGSLETLDAANDTIHISISNNQIAVTNATTASEFTITSKTGGFSIKSASNKYIGHTGSSGTLKTSNTDDYTNTLSINEGTFLAVCNTDFILQYNTDAKRFRYYKNTQNGIQLYKRFNGTTTYNSLPCPTYSISYDDDDGIAAGGQYFASASAAIAGTTITLEAEPNDGYTFDGWTVTKADDENTTVVVINNQFTMPEYDVLVTAGFTLIPTYTVTWMANGSQHATQAGLYANDIPNVPDQPDNCSANRVFVGWTAQADFVKSNSAPSDLFTTIVPAITKDTTFYAVYADKETTGGTTDTTIIMETYKAISGTFGSFTFSAAKNTGSTEPTYNDGNGNKDARLYAKGSLTISSSQSMTRIVFNLSTQGKNRLAPITASTGEIATQNAEDETVTWTGSATSITFTVGDKATYGKTTTDAGQLCFTSVEIRRGATPVTTYSNYSLYCSEATYTLTFMARGVQHAVCSGHTDEVVETIETPAACDDYTFAGWSTQQYAADNTATPTLNYSGKVPNGNTTYYAVYTNAGNVDMTNNYRRITQLTDLTTGNYVIAGYVSELYYALNTSTKDSYYLAGTSVSPEENVISAPDGSIIWRITINDGIATIYNSEANGYLYALQSGKYYNIYIGENANNAFTYSVSEGNWTFTSVTYTTQVLEYYISKAHWAFYKTPDAPIYLYKQQPDPNADVFYTTSPSCSSMPTGVEEVNTNSRAVKRIVNGRLLIEHNGVLYTPQGQKIQSL